MVRKIIAAGLEPMNCRNLLLIASLVLASATANAEPSSASANVVCKMKDTTSFENDTIACYDSAGCSTANELGGEPVEDYDIKSAPFALARGKIGAIVTSSPELIAAAKKVGAECQ